MTPDVRIVVALGGNALLRRGDRPDAGVEIEHIRAAARSLAVLSSEHQVVICHGNGPQVGLLALESAADTSLTQPYPLDVLGAQTQGMIGYWLTQSLHNAGVAGPVVSLITQTVVDAEDPAFAVPTKFVGRTYDHCDAQRLADQRHWTIAADGDRWRRVVPSPHPRRIVEQDTISRLLDAGTLVVCGGGGGVPVVEDADGAFRGVEAVVDKDLTAALLAIALEADRLLVLTDVDAVMRDFGTPAARPITRLALDELSGLHLPAGSMGPKIEACREFVAATGYPAGVGQLTDGAAVLAGTAGTTITATRQA